MLAVAKRTVLFLATLALCVGTLAASEVPEGPPNGGGPDPAAAATMLMEWANYLDGLPLGEAEGWDNMERLGHWLTVYADVFGTESGDPGGLTDLEAVDLFLACVCDFEEPPE